jgi:hypothetical protein
MRIDMSTKRKKFDTRTILIVLFVIVVIAATYIFITNLPAEEDTLTPEEVRRNIQLYLNKNIVVEGYYEPDFDGGSIVSNPIDQLSSPPDSWLRIDITNLDNESVFEDIKYHFTGIVTELEIEGSPTKNYVLFVEKAKQV